MKLFRKNVQKERDGVETGQLESGEMNSPTKRKQRKKCKAKERLPQQTRCSLQKAIALQLKLKDYALGER